MNDEGRLSGKLEALPRTTRGFWLAGCPQGDGSIGEHFDGKIDQPSLGRVAWWDFSKDMQSTRAVDVGPASIMGLSSTCRPEGPQLMARNIAGP